MAQNIIIRVIAVDWVEGLPNSEVGGTTAAQLAVHAGDTEEILQGQAANLVRTLLVLAREEMHKHTKKRKPNVPQQARLPEC